MSKQGNSGSVGEVVVQIPNTVENPNLVPNGSSSKEAESSTPKQVDSLEITSSPEISRFSPSPNRPPKIPTNETLVRKKSLTRSLYSKPKSRFGEQSYPIDLSAFEEKITPDMPSLEGAGGVDDDEEEEIYKKVNSQLSKKKSKSKIIKVLLEWATFFCLLVCLILGLTVPRFERFVIWKLEFWKWCVLVLVIFFGMLVTSWFVHCVFFFIERNFLLKKDILYFLRGLKKSVQSFIWLILVLVTWILLFKEGVKRSESATKILNRIFWTIVSLVIGAFLWLLKTFFIIVLEFHFNLNTFFDRVQESLFHQYVLEILSGPPLIESWENIGRVASPLSFRTSRSRKGNETDEKVVDVRNFHPMKRGDVSIWAMKLMVNVISRSGLSTVSNTLDESSEGDEITSNEITNDMEAIAAAYHIFKNVAQPGSKYIDEEDLLRFMIKEEVELVFPLIEGADTGRIDRNSLTDWVVKVHQERSALGYSLGDTKTVVKQFNKLVTGVLIIVVTITWLLLIEIATTKVLLVLLSQLVLAAFMFGNTCKTIFEAIVFIFVMHPFDVGDRCVIDGVQMIVEEMNILTTVFLTFDNEKLYYPNSVLSTKPIVNFYRSPDMGDNVEFSIEVKTPREKIGAIKEKIKKYLGENSGNLRRNHNIIVKEIQNVNKIKMALFFNYTMNFQDYGEKMKRRTELILELIRIFDELSISYDLLPQEVHRTNAASAMATTG